MKKMNHTIVILFTYILCCMPSYLHSMESLPFTDTQAIQYQLAILRKRKEHLIEDITLTKQSLAHHRNIKKTGNESYFYWKQKYPDDSMEDYSNVLEKRVTDAEQLLNDRQQTLNEVQEAIDKLDKVLKKEDIGEEKNNHSTTPFTKSSRI